MIKIKLNERKNRTDWIATQISRNIISRIKKEIKEDYVFAIPESVNFKKAISTLSEFISEGSYEKTILHNLIFFDGSNVKSLLPFYICVTWGIDNDLFPNQVIYKGGCFPRGQELIIFASLDFPENVKFDILVSQIKATLIHELEHVRQFRQDRIAETYKIGTLDYYLSPHEIEAYVKELYKHSKINHVKFWEVLMDFKEKLLDGDLNEYQVYMIIHGMGMYAKRMGFTP